MRPLRSNPNKLLSKVGSQRLRKLAFLWGATTLLLCASSLIPTEVHSEIGSSKWSSNGEFKLSGQFTQESDWTFSTGLWKRQHRFEKSAAGFGQSKTQVLKLSTAGETALDRILTLIASAEAPHKQYNAVHWKARVAPPAPPTQMTLGEIFGWIKSTPKQHHAISPYV